MKLTKLQRRTLQFFELFRSEPPTVGRQLSFNWFAWLPLLALGPIGCVLFFVPGCAIAGGFWIGLVVGAFCRDIGRFHGVVRIWPAYKEIINWQRLSELLESSEKHDA